MRARDIVRLKSRGQSASYLKDYGLVKMTLRLLGKRTVGRPLEDLLLSE